MADLFRGRRESSSRTHARPNRHSVDWQAIGTYRDAVIWVRERQTGCWVAAVVPMPPSDVKRPALICPSEEMVLAAECELQAEAVEAAMRYIEGGQEQPVGPTRGGEEEAQEAGLGPEARRFERIPVSLPTVVRASQFPGMGIRGMVRYVAAGGLMVELPVEVVSGSSLQVLIQTPQGPREVEGKVVWTAVNRDKVRHGLSFPEPQGPEFLDEFFREEDR
jgi:hypothetical protein